MTHDLKKGKYLYYYCTGNGDPNCPNKKKYTRGEIIEAQVLDSLKAIQIDATLLPWLIDSIREANAKERTLCEDAIKCLRNQIAANQRKQDKLLSLLLDEVITDATYKERREKILSDQREIEENIKAYQGINPATLADGARLLELVQHAVNTYKTQDPAEQRKLLRIVHSNLEWREEKLVGEYRKPFDILAVSAMPHQQKKAASTPEDGLRSIWLPEQDSNLRQGD